MAWSPDGQSLALADESGFIEVFDLAGRQVASQRITCPVAGLDYAPDGALLAIQCYHRLVLWEGRRLDGTQRGWYPNAITRPAWSPDGARLAAGMFDGTITIWWAGGGPHVVLASCGSTIETVAWSPDGASFAAGSKAHGVCLWRPPAGA
jgi:WD40 repeat protein